MCNDMSTAGPSQLESNRQPGVAEKPSTARGRKRDPEAHRRVMEVTLRLLRTLGYARLTIERVAKEAGVGRPTIYRWWGSKAELVHEAVFDGVPSVPEADSGVLRDDLRALVAYLVRILSRPEVVAYFRGVVGELDGRSDLERLSGQRTVLAREKYQDVFEGAITRGEITKNIDPDACFFALYGGIQTWLLFGPRVSRVRLEERFFSLIWATVEVHRVIPKTRRTRRRVNAGS
jgi:AcrR family transcriptional regulator